MQIHSSFFLLFSSCSPYILFMFCIFLIQSLPFSPSGWRAFGTRIKASESYQKAFRGSLALLQIDISVLEDTLCIVCSNVRLCITWVRMNSQKQAGHTRRKATARPLIAEVNRAAVDSLPCQWDSQQDEEARAGHVKMDMLFLQMQAKCGEKRSASRDTGGFKGALRIKFKKFPNTKCYEVLKRTVPQSCVMIFFS